MYLQTWQIRPKRDSTGLNGNSVCYRSPSALVDGLLSFVLFDFIFHLSKARRADMFEQHMAPIRLPIYCVFCVLARIVFLICGFMQHMFCSILHIAAVTQILSGIGYHRL